MDSPTLALSKYYRRISYDFPAHHIPSVLTCLSGTQPPSPLTRCTATLCPLRDLSESFKAVHILSDSP